MLILIEQFRCPGNRDGDDVEAVARALVHEARRYGLEIPAWLATIAGYREPPPPLRLVIDNTAASVAPTPRRPSEGRR